MVRTRQSRMHEGTRNWTRKSDKAPQLCPLQPPKDKEHQRKSKLLPRGDGPFQVTRRINNNAYELDLPPSYNISNSFNVCDLSPFDVGFKNSWSNSLQEREDDEGMTTSLKAPSRRITRSMSRRESSIPSPLSFFCIILVWIP